MKRYLDKNVFDKFVQDFSFLFKIIRNSKGEYDLRLRDNRFNIYYQGNSMAEVKLDKEAYEVTVNEKFVYSPDSNETIFIDDDRINKVINNAKISGGYVTYTVSSEHIYSFLQKKHLEAIARRVKKVDYGEELTFEQMLITDNLDRQDYFIIDRQVTDRGLQRQRMDILALRQVEGNKCCFEVLELKLGNNPDIKDGKVISQLEKYTNYIEDSFQKWKNSYEKTYWQIKDIEIFSFPQNESIDIIPPVLGKVVIIGYSKIAEDYVEELESKSNFGIEQFKYKIK